VDKADKAYRRSHLIKSNCCILQREPPQPVAGGTAISGVGQNGNVALHDHRLIHIAAVAGQRVVITRSLPSWLGELVGAFSSDSVRRVCIQQGESYIDCDSLFPSSFPLHYLPRPVLAL
jgi:hypothetical protein